MKEVNHEVSEVLEKSDVSLVDIDVVREEEKECDTELKKNCQNELEEGDNYLR